MRPQRTQESFFSNGEKKLTEGWWMGTESGGSDERCVGRDGPCTRASVDPSGERGTDRSIRGAYEDRIRRIPGNERSGLASTVS